MSSLKLGLQGEQHGLNPVLLFKIGKATTYSSARLRHQRCLPGTSIHWGLQWGWLCLCPDKLFRAVSRSGATLNRLPGHVIPKDAQVKHQVPTT